ncbi:MAG: hypothetical protein ACREJN_10130, partial [Nitrospiraceae bacterium]
MIYDRRYPMRPTAAKGFYLYFDPADATIPQQNSLWDTLLANKDDELIIDLTKALSGPISFHSSHRAVASSPSSPVFSEAPNQPLLPGAHLSFHPRQ